MSVRMEQLVSTGRIFIKYDIWAYFEKKVKIKDLLKSDKNKVYFTWRPLEVFDNISLISS